MYRPWVDSAKGIGVILVIVGHLLYNSSLVSLHRAIYSFHIPLFFVLSGYLYHGPGSKTKIQYALNKFRRLIVPCFMYMLLSIPTAVRLIQKGENAKSTIEDLFYLKGSLLFNLPLWFLVVSFYVYLFAIILKVETRSFITLVLMLAACYGIGNILYIYRKLPLWNTLGFNRTFLCLAFFIVGMLIRSLDEHFSSRLSGRFCFVYPFMLVFSTLIWYYTGVAGNKKISLYQYKLGRYSFTFLAGVFGAISLMMLSRFLLNRKNAISNLSKYAILFLGTQYYWIVPFRRKMKQAGWAMTVKYDICVIIAVTIYLILAPRIYEFLAKKIKLIKLLN